MYKWLLPKRCSGCVPDPLEVKIDFQGDFCTSRIALAAFRRLKVTLDTAEIRSFLRERALPCGPYASAVSRTAATDHRRKRWAANEGSAKIVLIIEQEVSSSRSCAPEEIPTRRIMPGP